MVFGSYRVLVFTVTLIVFTFFGRIQSQDINDRFKCLLTDQEAVDLRYDGSENYMVIGEARDVSTTITRFTICRPLSNDMPTGAASDYIIYVVECFQLGTQLLSSVTSADIVDSYSSQAMECQTSMRPVLSLSATTTTAPITTAITSEVTTTPFVTTTAAGFNISSLVAMQVLDETGFVVDHVATTQPIRLRLQAFSTEVYKLPYVNRCWYVLSLGSEEEEEEEEDKHDEKEEDKEYEEEEMEFDEGTMFVEYGCALYEPVLIETDKRKGAVFVTNGPLDIMTTPFNLQSLFDLDFDTLTFRCEVDLCTLDQYCREKCPADAKTYRLPPNETVYGILSTTISVEKQETTTTTVPTKPTTDNPFIIRRTEYPPPPKPAAKTGMDKAQPYLIIGCIVVGCIVMFLLCYLSFRIMSAKNGEPGEGNPQDSGKFSQPGSLPGHAVPSHVGGRVTGPSPPPGYSTGAQLRGRGTSIPSQSGQFSHSVTQPLLTPSPTRGRMPQQTELIMSPGRLSDAYYKNSVGLPSRYQDSQCGGTVVGGEYYPVRERSAGQLIGRELYYLPEGLSHLDQSHGSLLSKDAFREPGSTEKRALGSLLAREAALRQGSAARRDLFGVERDTHGQKSDVGNLISKSLSEYIDRHGVAALADIGQN